MNKQHEPIWNKIQAFPLDDSQAVFPFSKKLAQENNWTETFAANAILEYKKFLLLCCISPRGASPSPIIDTVWHLHLTYTESYWTQLCEKTLGKPLHHHPSRGGPTENEKHTDWYAFTLSLYTQTFGQYPPEDIWPAQLKPPESIPTKISYTIIPRHVRQQVLFGIVLLAMFVLIRFGSIHIYRFNGPQFLEFGVYLGIVTLIIVTILSAHWKKQVAAIASHWYPAEYNIFQATDFLYGKNRALQTAIVDLLERRVLRFENHRFVYQGHQPGNNPLLIGLKNLAVGESINYDTISNTFYHQPQFTNERFDELNRLCRKTNLWWGVPFIGVVTIVTVRILQGVANGKPVSFLIGGTFVFAVIYAIIASANPVEVIIRRFAKKKLEEKFGGDSIANQMHPHLPGFAMYGTKAKKWQDYDVALFGIFALHPAAAANWDQAASGMSSSSGSSCGSDGGGSCGSSCGGGGCGGCGGGD